MTQKLRRDYQRAQCIALRNAGMTCREISTIVGIFKSSVQRALKRFEERGDIYDRPRSGRPKKLNDRSVRMLQRLTQNEGRYSSHEICIRLNNSFENPICRRTFLSHNDWMVESTYRELFQRYICSFHYHYEVLLAINKKQITNEVVTREYTVNLHKRLHGIAFKKRAPRAIKELKQFAEKMMKTPDVRIDSKLNKEIWSQGINHVPYRVRVRLARQRNEDEDSLHKLYTLVTFVRVPSFKANVDNE
ncbi:unnamed protein product [Rotaria magnacalcarata]